jgi:Uma2 family endonuclease
MVGMNLALRKAMSLTEFLEWEERQELRYEFDGLEPSAVTGGSLRHATIQRNLAMALGNRLRGKPCQFFGSDLKIQAAKQQSLPGRNRALLRPGSVTQDRPQPGRHL